MNRRGATRRALYWAGLACLGFAVPMLGPASSASADTSISIGQFNSVPTLFIQSAAGEPNDIRVYDCGSGGSARTCVYDRWEPGDVNSDDLRCDDFADVIDPISGEDSGQNTTAMCPALSQIVVHTGDQNDQVNLNTDFSPRPNGFNTRAVKYARSYIYGEANDDILNGGVGLDFIYGGAGGDTLRGNAESDQLRGEVGPDAMEGGSGADLIDGGTNNDPARFDYVDYFPKTSGVRVTEDNVPNDGNADDSNADNVVNVDKIAGSRFDDFLMGDPNGGNVISGDDGNDTLGAPQSRINIPSTAEGSRDEFVGGPGSDLITYEMHNVTLPSPCYATVNITLDDRFNDGVGGYEFDNVHSDIERVQGAASLPNNVTGSALGNEIRGGACRDTLNGGAGDDALSGLHDKDHFIGGPDRDKVDYFYSEFGVDVTPATDGQYNDGPGGNEDYVEGDVEDIEGSNLDDKLTGTPYGNRLIGNDGDDRLIGLAGHDVFVGGPGVDTADYSYSGSGVTVTVGDGQANDGPPGEGDEVAASTQDVIGTNDRDVITGNELANRFDGRDGTDVLDGGAGPDRLFPNELADGRMDRWKDYVHGGAGNDAINTKDCIPALDEQARPSCAEVTEDVIECGDDEDSIFHDVGVDTVLDPGQCEHKEPVTSLINLSALPPANAADPALTVGGTPSKLAIGDNGAHDNQLLIETDLESRDNPVVTVIDLGGAVTPPSFSAMDCVSAYNGHAVRCRGITEIAIDLGKGNDRLHLFPNYLRNGIPSSTRVNAGEGDDTVWIDQKANVEVEGGPGSDTIYSTEGSQSLFGNSRAASGRAAATGPDESDTISYLGRTDAVNVDLTRPTGNGAPGENDELGGFTNVIGGDGDDTLVGDARSNRIEGRGGNDHLDPGRDQVVDTLDGGDGTDALEVASHLDGVEIEVPSRSRDRRSPDWDTHTRLERFDGSNGNDTITGTDAGETLRGLAGDDVINARGGDDVLIGGANSDTLNGGSGTNTAGYDERTEAVNVDLAKAGTGSSETGIGGSAIDVSVTGATAGGNRDFLASIQNVTGGAGNDSLLGSSATNSLLGNGGDDQLDGRGGNDNFLPEPGGDRYAGSAGNDTLLYSARNYSGRTPKPAIRVSAGDGIANDGEDAGGDGVAEEADNVGPDIELITGNTGNDTLEGAAGNDLLVGLDGNDTLRGGDGNDVLIDDMFGASAAHGKDKLYGGNGNDTLNGGADFDSYWGDNDDDAIYAKDGLLGEPVRCGFGTGDYASIDLNAPGADGDLLPDQDCERTNFKGWSWSDWNPISNAEGVSYVSVASRAPGMLDAFFQSPDGVIRWAPNHGGGWFNLGTTLMTSRLAPGSVGMSGTVELLAVGLYDNHLYHQANKCFFCGWSKVGSGELTDSAGRPRPVVNGHEVGLVSSPRAVKQPGSNTYDVYVRGTDNRLWVVGACSATAAKCGGAWGPLPGYVSGNPAVTWLNGKLYVFAKTLNGNGLQYRVGSLATGWSPWTSLGWLPGQSAGGSFDGSPAAAPLGSGSVELFFADDRRLVFHASLKESGALGSWESQGGPASADPDAVAWGPGRIDVVSSKGNDNQLYRYYFSGEG